MDYASRDGHLEVVKYLSEKRNEGCTTDAMDLASRRGHIEVVKYLSENRTEGCTAKAMDGAARMGHLAVVKYLFENRTEWCIPTANGDYNAHKDKNVVAGLENGQVQIDITGLSSGQWVVDLVGYSNSIKVSQTFQLIELWSLSCNPSDGVAGTLVYCSYKATSTNIYARIPQNKDYVTDNNLDQPLNSLNGQFQYLTTWFIIGNVGYRFIQASFQFQDGKMTIIKNSELNNGFSLPPFFYRETSSSAYVMHTPVWFNGAVTSAGSDYLRTELRQEANWNALLGYQSLTVLRSINSVSQNGVFVGQILAEYNGKHSPVFYVALKPNTANPSTYDLKAFLGTTYEIKIRIAQGEVKIFCNGELKTKDYNTKFAANIFSNVYFKTGSYGQTKRADDASINNQVSQILIYKLEVSN
ncbi:hypothetical protein HDU92_004496 [Lobulomyces angularis]|nr:hypothetical protein HDU92_004496 [Lobulomyces angularis]